MGLLEWWVAASAAVSQGTLTMLHHRVALDDAARLEHVGHLGHLVERLLVRPVLKLVALLVALVMEADLVAVEKGSNNPPELKC